MKIENLKLSLLENNEGQIKGVPSNPRDNTAAEFNKLKKSLTETPEFMEYRPLLVYPLGSKYIVIDGNARLRALRALKKETAECIILPATCTPHQLKKYALLGNGSYGKWNWDNLANEWEEMGLQDFNLPVWAEPTAEVVTPVAAPSFLGQTPTAPVEQPYIPPTVYSPNLNPVDGEKPVTDADIASTAFKMETAFQNQIQQMQEVVCPCCGHKFYIKG